VQSFGTVPALAIMGNRPQLVPCAGGGTLVTPFRLVLIANAGIS
jgi:hypothetical protein